MPAVEQVINLPLSGEEVRQIILAKLEQALASDSRLSDFVAFPAFQCKLDYAIVLQGAVHDTVERQVTVGRGTVTDDPAAPAVITTGHVEISPMPPNEARVDAGLGVPVLTRDEKGRQVEKKVKYTAEHKNRAKGGK